MKKLIIIFLIGLLSCLNGRNYGKLNTDNGSSDNENIEIILGVANFLEEKSNGSDYNSTLYSKISSLSSDTIFVLLMDRVIDNNFTTVINIKDTFILTNISTEFKDSSFQKIQNHYDRRLANGAIYILHKQGIERHIYGNQKSEVFKSFYYFDQGVLPNHVDSSSYKLFLIKK